MYDITKCSDSRCPAKLKCERFTSEPRPGYQSYTDFHREDDAVNCSFFIYNSEPKKEEDERAES